MLIYEMLPVCEDLSIWLPWQHLHSPIKALSEQQQGLIANNSELERV